MSGTTLQEYVFGRQMSEFLTLASTALLVYDYLLTFPDEIQLVWLARWNVGKFNARGCTSGL